jgi:serine protease
VAATLAVPATAATQRPVATRIPTAAGRLVQGAVEVMRPVDLHTAKHRPAAPTPGPSQLVFGGGSSGRGVQRHPSVYLVFWGSQWNHDDPYAAYEQRFFRGLYGRGDDWTTVASQYCDSVKTGTLSCPTRAPHIGRPFGGGVLKGVWFDDTTFAMPTDLWLLGGGAVDSVAGEAVRAAQHFGNTTASENTDVQYVINEPSGYDSLGFGFYCAYHSTVSSNFGTLVYTDLPYQNDAGNSGLSCGQNAVNPGAAGRYDGVSIVAGHEFIEALTDPFPDTGWVDGGGAETGDKCQWIRSGTGKMANLRLSTGTFAVQSTWSDVANNGHGGCVVHASQQ